MCQETHDRYQAALVTGDPAQIAAAEIAHASTDDGDAYFVDLAADAYDRGADTECFRIHAVRDKGRAIRNRPVPVTLTATELRAPTEATPPADRFARPPRPRKRPHPFPALRITRLG